MQQIEATLPAPGQLGALNCNIIDDSFSSGAWSTGGQITAPVSAQATITNPWTVYGWGIVLRLTLTQINFANPFGKLGRVIAGPLLGSGGVSSPVSAQTPFSPPPAIALPNLATIWDGAINDAPPFWVLGSTTPTEGGEVAFSTQLPNPVTLSPGAQLAFGLWLTPSLTTTTLAISGAAYTILYS